MKKKLSLLVALLMVLTLIPFNAFAVKTNFNTKQSVGDDDKNIPVSAVLEIEKADVVSPGVVTVYLGENAEFAKDDKGNVKFNVFVAGVQLDKDRIKYDPDKTFATFNLNDGDIDKLVPGTELRLSANIDLDDAKAGNQSWTINAEGIKLGKYERVYASVETDSGKFTKRINSVATVGRGNNKQLATVEIKVKEVGQVLELRLPSEDFVWEEDSTVVVNGTVLHVDKDKRCLFIRSTQDKVVVTPVITVQKDAPLGDIEIEVSRADEFTNDHKISGDIEAEYVTLGEYKQYGIVLKTVKDVKEEFVNGDKYAVDMELKTDNKTGLASYYDFEVEGADVWITNLKDPYTLTKGLNEEKNADDEFTIGNIDRDTNKVKFTLNVKPDWDAKGEVVVKVMSRYKEEAKCVALKLLPVVSMDVKSKEILAGERIIEVDDIVLTESQARALKPGEKYGVTLKGMKFAEAKFEDKGKLEAEGIKVKDLKLGKDDQTISFTVDGRSKKDAPAKIVLKDLKVVTTRSLPLGEYKLMLVHLNDEKSVVDDADYVEKVGSTNYALQEIESKPFFKAVSELGRVKKTTVFTLGSADYTVDGAAMKLDNPVFTQDNYTMLPVRAIADALGVEVVWNQENKTATFIDGDKVVSITVNSKVLYKNGIAYPMATKSSVKAERMFISVASVGDAFGLNRGMDYMYDEAAKTVTIYPEAKKADK